MIKFSSSSNLSYSRLHRPIFVMFFIPGEHMFPTTKQIIFPTTITFFLGGRGSWIWTVVVLDDGQMSWHTILIFEIILISKRGYQSRLLVLVQKVVYEKFWANQSMLFYHQKLWEFGMALGSYLTLMIKRYNKEIQDFPECIATYCSPL